MKNKNFKRVLSAVTIAALTLGLITGCSGGGSEEATADESGATVIKFGIHVANPAEQEAVTNNIVEAFNKANDGKYKVEFEAADTETHSKNMKLKAEDGTLPQIFWIEGSEASEYSEAGVLMEMQRSKQLLAAWKQHLRMIMDSSGFRTSVMYRVFSITKSCLTKQRLNIPQTRRPMKNLLR